jgi:hypothetical protein
MGVFDTPERPPPCDLWSAESSEGSAESMEGSTESAEESADGTEGSAESMEESAESTEGSAESTEGSADGVEASAEKHVGRAFRRDEKLPKFMKLRKFVWGVWCKLLPISRPAPVP